jgi:hypothetical protein
MDNINIRITDKFKELTPVEGFVITNWNKEDIKEFTYTTLLICPLEYDYSEYYTITVEKANELEKELNEEIEKIMNENK